jgi:hypothetical protein
MEQFNSILVYKNTFAESRMHQFAQCSTASTIACVGLFIQCLQDAGPPAAYWRRQGYENESFVTGITSPLERLQWMLDSTRDVTLETPDRPTDAMQNTFAKNVNQLKSGKIQMMRTAVTQFERVTKSRKFRVD